MVFSLYEMKFRRMFINQWYQTVLWIFWTLPFMHRVFSSDMLKPIVFLWVYPPENKQQITFPYGVQLSFSFPWLCNNTYTSETCCLIKRRWRPWRWRRWRRSRFLFLPSILLWFYVRPFFFKYFDVRLEICLFWVL